MDLEIHNKAIEYIKSHKTELLNRFCSVENYTPSTNPITIFMAGSPGAGKTEFSISFIPELQDKDPGSKIVRIDVDEVRTFLPMFDGHNSEEVHAAACIGVDKIYDSVLHNQQNCILDGTMQNYHVSYQNVSRALNKKRDKVGIMYIYQDPLVAWDFTKKREKLDNRRVPKEVFIKAFFAARDNVLLLKRSFGPKIELNIVIQDERNHLSALQLNANTIEKRLFTKYTIGSLNKLLN